MKVLVINALQGNAAAEYCRNLDRKGHSARQIDLCETEIKSCKGCWTCWYKKPGTCIWDDGMTPLYPAIMDSDRVVVFSPVIMGFVSARVKTFFDRFIPLLSPYMEIVQGEIHHRKRYVHYPELGLILEPGPDTDEEDLRIIREIFSRTALNFKTKLVFSLTTTQSNIKEASHDINCA